ncbi:hypothetical protein ACORB6_000059 [Listeria monocytogenes]|uniref:hypothetical protein n=1 Tax=Listeria monocytogenes TaxID=1639 RepID=UPI0010F1E7F1|nr:hypothetical protein [Listeria monocytogenes]EAC9089470.1 hypothetical protein [Listeria monocytogenes]EAD8664764.1 hypothetical protein [Listeria monocytogenes]EAE6785547.1 hypothetical protein [Listeria monocytogenes]EAE6806591.1 hypothetical protein [Listeria monocytogenes]EAE6809703.1 hypothetical protein [Listeria monocytogenes]
MWMASILFLISLIVSIVFFLLAIKKKDRSKNLMKGITFLAISYTLWLFFADMSDSNFFIIFSFWIIAMALIYVFLLLLSGKLNLKKYQYISKIVVIPLSFLFFIGGVLSVNNADDVKKETPKKKEVRSNTDYYGEDKNTNYDDVHDTSSASDEDLEKSLPTLNKKNNINAIEDMQNRIRNTLIPSINDDIKNADSSNLKQELTVISNLSDDSYEHSNSMLSEVKSDKYSNAAYDYWEEASNTLDTIDLYVKAIIKDKNTDSRWEDVKSSLESLDESYTEAINTLTK